MGKAEEFIKEHTTRTSWVVPNVAREAAKIAREETIKDMCEWLYNHNDYICGSTNSIIMYNMDKLIEDLKKHFEDKL